MSTGTLLEGSHKASFIVKLFPCLEKLPVRQVRPFLKTAGGDILVGDGAIHVVDRTIPIPVAVGPFSVADVNIPVSDEAIHVADDIIPLAVGAISVSDGNIPVADEAIPVTDEVIPVSVGAISVSDVNISKSDEAIPVADALSSRPNFMSDIAYSKNAPSLVLNGA